jgi:predicted Zn-dependent protease
MPSTNSEVKLAPDAKFAERFNEALKLRSARKLSQAQKILLALAEEKKDSASVFGILGDVYWQQNALPDAIECFTRASRLSPGSELASLGLFHVLWESGQVKEALAEMKRFLSAFPSPEYAKILGELIPIPHSSQKRTAATMKPRAKKVAAH